MTEDILKYSDKNFNFHHKIDRVPKKSGYARPRQHRGFLLYFGRLLLPCRGDCSF